MRDDFNRDRIYLPRDWVGSEAVVAALAGQDPAPLAAATRRLLALADTFYADAAAGMHYLPWRARRQHPGGGRVLSGDRRGGPARYSCLVAAAGSGLSPP